jgi:hypothetical protein
LRAGIAMRQFGALGFNCGGPAMRHPRILAGLCAIVLSGCSFGPPEQAEILVNTTPPGASCLLTGQGQPLATIAPTPAIALVAPAAGGLAVSCRRPGFADANVPLPPYPSSVLERRVDIALVPNPPLGPPR